MKLCRLIPFLSGVLTPELTGREDNLETIQALRMKAALFALRFNELFGGCEKGKHPFPMNA